MIGIYDFCAHYDWTFAWIEEAGGEEALTAYWDEAIHRDSQTHASDLIKAKGFEGMKEYWGHTLQEEAADYFVSEGEGVVRVDMHRCPSKGFLIDNGVGFYRDYPNHCMGWIGPMMEEAGFTIDHEHNHTGQCWWEFRKKEDPTPGSAPGTLAGDKDVRLTPEWEADPTPIDRFIRSRKVE